MDVFECQRHFSCRADGGTGIVGGPIGDSELSPAVCTALTVLSGMLRDCEDDESLDDAVRHGLSLVEGGVISPDDLAEQVNRVLVDVLECGRQLSACGLPGADGHN
jgi:hypothetical protein